MMSAAWRAGVRKEMTLLLRDWHALGLLFFMPLAFVLVMSLAMQDEFAARAGKKIGVVVVDRDGSGASMALLAALQASQSVTVTVSDAASSTALGDLLREGDDAFAIDIAKGYGTALNDSKAALSDVVTLIIAPETAKQTEAIFQGTLREILARERLQAILTPVLVLSGGDSRSLNIDSATIAPRVAYLYRGSAPTQAPSAVQQSVPAWLVFGTFFIVIPLSNTWIRERQQGTARRLRTMPVSTATLVASKLLPYFLVNQLQVALMLAVGRFLVPALGGQALQLNGSMLALALVGAAVSIAAIGYALLVASVSRTTEQASLLGGAGNLILAAIGGIMVPKFIMPPAMQTLTQVSPMSWGLEGFLDVLLRGGTVADVAGESLALIAFGSVMIILAAFVQARRWEK